VGDAPALQLWKVGKRYGLLRKHEALRGVSISVARGECYGLAGPNGAGKTTLIRLLLGLSAPDSGEVRLLGRRPDDPDVRSRVGFVPEAAELPPSASPRQLVKRFARLRGLPLREAEPQGVSLLERLGMAELLDRPSHKLSKGERQRTLLALAMLGAPELLVLDEPTDGLDPLGRALVRRVLREERALGRTVFLNSHLLSETERICTRVGILHRGQLVREEAVRESNETSGSTAVVLSTPPAVQVPGVRPAPSLQGQVTEAAGATVLVDHDDLEQLNAALDRLRGAGALIAEVRRVRQDLEASFEAAVTGAPAQVAGPVEAPAEPPRAEAHPARPLLAAARVAGEIAADLAARKVGWMALAFAVLVLGGFLWLLRSDAVGGAAIAAQRFGGPAGVSDPGVVAHWIGRWAAGGAFWSMLVATLALSGLFAPPILDPRRTILLLAQPVGRGDFALGIFAAVCGLSAAAHAFLALLLFLGLRALGFPVSPRFLLLPLPLLFALAALYAGVLLATYAVRSGPFAMGFGLFSLLLVLAAGNSDAARPGATVGIDSMLVGLLPRVVPLGQQAMRLGGGEELSPLPFVLTGMYTCALVIALQIAARRSER
jgi:ABC-2 type transport system ATP-binding protein